MTKFVLSPVCKPLMQNTLKKYKICISRKIHLRKSVDRVIVIQQVIILIQLAMDFEPDPYTCY